jgi:hypothetical protein
MLLYNVTVGIDADIEAEWVQWMKAKHIPDVMATGMFVDYKFYKVLHDNNDGTISYSIQYFSNTIEDVVNYLEVLGPAMAEEHRLKFLNKHVAFRTLLEEI